MKRYRILTFDGGGIRGALTISLLNRINNKLPGIFKNTDLYAGTSTGALIALGFAAKLSIEDLQKLYSFETSKRIFKPYSPGILRPRYNINRFKDIVESIFPSNMCLTDLDYKVIIPAFKVDEDNNNGWRPIFFSNLPSSDYNDMKVVDVALASCAAPIYFSSYNKYIDGGVVANNPSTVALSFALGMLCGRRSLSSIRLFSVGTGYSPNYIKYNTAYWGAIQWLLSPDPPVPLINLLLDGAARADDMITSQLLGKNYQRLNPILTESIGMDQYWKIDFLKDFADRLNIDDTINWLMSNW